MLWSLKAMPQSFLSFLPLLHIPWDFHYSMLSLACTCTCMLVREGYTALGHWEEKFKCGREIDLSVRKARELNLFFVKLFSLMDNFQTLLLYFLNAIESVLCHQQILTGKITEACSWGMHPICIFPRASFNPIFFFFYSFEGKIYSSFYIPILSTQHRDCYISLYLHFHSILICVKFPCM